MLPLRPHHSWITRIAGNGPGPGGRLRYAFVPFRSIVCPLRSFGASVGGPCSALNCSSVNGPVDDGRTGGADGGEDEHAATRAAIRAMRMWRIYRTSVARGTRAAASSAATV